MTIQCFICASPLYPDEPERDAALHEGYLRAHLEAVSGETIELVVIQNGCPFPSLGVKVIRNPLVKSVAYNWLLCDANCHGDYWVFLPEDCRITGEGWAAIRQHTAKGKDCFALSCDPKVLVCRKGVFEGLPQDLKVLCDMNFLGKEIGCVILREELDRRDLHCISRTWRKVSEAPDRWGNELYGEMNLPDHPDINKALRLPIFQDFGFDGWKATQEELEAAFLKIVSAGLDRQHEAAVRLKHMIATHGPRIAEVPYKGRLGALRDRLINR